MATTLPPGLAGYVEMRQANSQLDTQNLSGLAKMQAMAEAQYKMGLENQYRQKMATATTPEERLAISQQFMGPDALGRSLQDAETRKAQIAATRESTLTRIHQTWSQFEQRMAAQKERIKDAREAQIWEQEYKTGRAVFDAAWKNANLSDQTGQTVPMPVLPAPMQRETAPPGVVPGATPAASPQVPAAASSGLGALDAILAGKTPAEEIAILNAASGRPTSMSVTPQGGVVPNRGDAAYQPPAVAQPPVPNPVVAQAPAAGAVPTAGGTGYAAVAAPGTPGSDLSDFPHSGPPITHQYRDEGSNRYVPNPQIAADARPALAADARPALAALTPGGMPSFGNVVTGGPAPVAGAAPVAAVAPVAAAAPIAAAAVTGGGSPGAPATPRTVPAMPKPPEYASWPKAKRDAFDARAAVVQFEAQTRADAAQHKVDAKVSVQGGRESVQQQRVLTGANQAVAALQNIVQLPIESSTGILGTRGHSKGLMNAAGETLVQKMTSQDVQTYQILTTGIQRSLAAIESAGLAPPVSLTSQMDGVIWKEGWTNLSKLYALAETRQIVEKAMDVLASNERVSPQQKELVQKILTDVRAAVPFTNADLIELQKKLQVNPNTTLEEVVNIKKGGGGGGGVSAEERALIDRYLKKK